MGQQVDRGIPEPFEHDRVRQRQAEHLLDERAEDDVRQVDRPVQHQPDLRIGQRTGDLRLDQGLHLAAHQVERLGEQRHAGRAAFQGGPPDVPGDNRVVGDELVERLPAGAGGDRRRLVEPDAADHLADLGHHRVLHRLGQFVLGLEVVHHGARRTCRLPRPPSGWRWPAGRARRTGAAPPRGSAPGERGRPDLR